MCRSDQPQGKYPASRLHARKLSTQTKFHTLRSISGFAAKYKRTTLIKTIAFPQVISQLYIYTYIVDKIFYLKFLVEVKSNCLETFKHIKNIGYIIILNYMKPFSKLPRSQQLNQIVNLIKYQIHCLIICNQHLYQNLSLLI